ncbi:hypothetical protein B0P06_000113 [Clostridium saccharoperbutylacetonicum]|nr:hypothetical protein [Clostridium saccharoperbutylacetonicum]
MNVINKVKQNTTKYNKMLDDGKKNYYNLIIDYF